MARQIAAGIDIGTFQTKVVIAEEVLQNGKRAHKIIGTGLSETRGVTRGYITDTDEAARSIRSALNQAEKSAGVSVKRAYFSTGGVGLNSITTTAHHIITRADLEITENDLETVLESAEAAIPAASLTNRKIINSVPIEYKIDGKPVWGRVEGLKAQKLEIKAIFITALVHHLEDIIKSAELAGIEVVDIFASPVASSFVTLSKKQKKAGCVLLDIGAETLSMVVFENGNLLSLEVFPTGGADITNDIALGLKVTLEEAEGIKRDSFIRVSYSKKKLEEIIAARLEDGFELIEAHLKKIGRDGLLPAGVIITGGSADITDIKQFAENSLQLPVRIAEVQSGEGEKGRRMDNIWSVASGLSLAGSMAGNDYGIPGSSKNASISTHLKRFTRKVGQLISQILP